MFIHKSNPAHLKNCYTKESKMGPGIVYKDIKNQINQIY